MNILLDHQLDQKLKDHILGHNVTAAGLEGLQQIANGRLLAAAKKAGFDLFLTGDKNILFQNNIQKLPITVIQLPGQKLSELEPILPFIQKAVDSVQLDNGFYELNEAGDLKKHSERPSRKERRRRKTTHWLLLPKPLREGRFSTVSKRHFLGNKTSFMAPRTGELTIVVQHSMPERVTITLDMGIPRFTHFSITFPTNGVSPEEIDGCSKQAFDVLLDDLTAFLLSMHYEQNEIAGVIRLAAECFAEVNESHATDAKMVQDASIRMYQSRFELPESFIRETHARVMTAALVRRVPPVRMLNLVPLEGPENHPGRVIELMGEQSTHSTPLPFEVRVEEKLIAPPLLKAKDWQSRLLQKPAILESCVTA